MKGFLGAIAGTFAIAAACLATPASANLLVNGDFGTGDMTGWSESDSCCWYVGTVGDNSYAFGQGFHEGAVGTNGMLQQTFSDVAGQHLFVTFDYAANDASSYQYISFDGNTVAGTLISGPQNYKAYAFNLGVSTGSDTITFNGRNDPSYNWLSNIVVDYGYAAVPEPASLALLGTGLVAAAGAYRRRRKAKKA